MTKLINNSPSIKTSKGFGRLEKVFVSELGFLMLKINNVKSYIIKSFEVFY